MIFTFVRGLLWILVVIGGAVVRCEEPEDCVTTSTCSQCIRIPDCIWCLDPSVKTGRCQNKSTTACPKKFFDDKPGSVLPINVAPRPSQKPKNTKKSKSSAKDIPVRPQQVRPQMVDITLRPNKGKPLRFNMRYSQAVDYPLDIYYMKDGSKSQDIDRGNGGLRRLSRNLPQIMINITSELKLGLGTFVEKPIPPFIHPRPELFNTPQIKNECPTCVPAFSFRNLLPLDSDLTAFKNAVENLTLSYNIDLPESGFDGIMQAIVCREKIGWRNTSRKLIVYSSNSEFHIAGDGKLLGIVKPNDGCCHLDKNGYYDASTKQDYPSIQQLNALAKKNSINLIFAVTKDVSKLYEEIVKIMDGAYIGIQEHYNDEEVVKIIRKEYEKITSFVKLSESELSPNLHLTYYSRCLNSTADLNKTNRCEGLKVGDSVEFEIHIELLRCPPNQTEWNQKFRITPEGVDEELIVNVRMKCDCDCDSPKNKTYKVNATSCSRHGNFQCDQCVCQPEYSGHDCSCSTKTENCQPSNLEAPLCFDRGTCECNRCHCNSSEYWGQFCECSNFTCPSTNGNLCSNNGACICDKCYCKADWTGDDCSCHNRTDECSLGSEQELCSQHGKCTCNKCKCDPGYWGRYCERCKDCFTQCEKFNECVMCMRNESKSVNWKQCQAKCKYNFEEVNDTQIEDYVSKQDYVRCIVNNDDCQLMYAYDRHDRRVQIKIRKEKTCKSAIQVMPFVIGIITAIVVVGFTCLIMWKILTVIQDRKEYAKFEEERSKMKWQRVQSPLYQPPAVTYPNPMYKYFKKATAPTDM